MWKMLICLLHVLNKTAELLLLKKNQKNKKQPSIFQKIGLHSSPAKAFNMHLSPNLIKNFFRHKANFKKSFSFHIKETYTLFFNIYAKLFWH